MINTLTILEVIAWMDGGSVTLKCKDSDGVDVDLEFVQHMILKDWMGDHFPGSLLLNKAAVDIRSESESKILAALQRATYATGITDLDRQLVGDCITFVASDHYLEVARLVRDV